MRLSLKIVVSSLLLFFGFQGSAGMNTDYVSVFKPEKSVQRGISELQKNIRKDIFRVNSVVNSREKKVSLNNERTESSRVPAEI